MPTGYHLSNIRTLLTEGFSAAELRDFCFDAPPFRPVHHELADLTGKAAIVSHLLEFAERKNLLGDLLAWTEQTNPAKYTEHQPYHLNPPPTSSPHPPSPSAQRPLRVFLCHASGDKPAVRELYGRLQADGFEPWLDEEDLLPGQDWDYEIRQAVRRAEVVLVCLSPASLTKAGYVQKEIKFVLDVADQQPEGAIFLIPLRLEPCDVPERLSRWHWVDLFDGRGYEYLLRALHHRAEQMGIMSMLPPTLASPHKESLSSQTTQIPTQATPVSSVVAESQPSQPSSVQVILNTQTESPSALAIALLLITKNKSHN